VRVSARVRVNGTKRLLKWSLRRIAGQSVTFVEQGAGVAHVLLRTDRARGSVRFRPAPGGSRPRQIVAFVSENGLPRDRIVLTSFLAPAPPKLHAVRGLRLRGAVLRWSRQPGAAQYSLMVRAANGQTASFLTRRSLVRVPSTMRGEKLTVWISALGANGAPGPLRPTRLHTRRR
jgi:hypothetical protein